MDDTIGWIIHDEILRTLYVLGIIKIQERGTPFLTNQF